VAIPVLNIWPAIGDGSDAVFVRHKENKRYQLAPSLIYQQFYVYGINRDSASHKQSEKAGCTAKGFGHMVVSTFRSIDALFSIFAVTQP
jgi:hypothetical protein